MKKEPYHILIRDYDYNLPHDRIAEFPLRERDQSKLLVFNNGEITDDHFFNLPSHLPENSTLILNNTRVIEARVLFKKPTGGVIEIFCLSHFNKPLNNHLHQLEDLNGSV